MPRLAERAQAPERRSRTWSGTAPSRREPRGVAFPNVVLPQPQPGAMPACPCDPCGMLVTVRPASSRVARKRSSATVDGAGSRGGIEPLAYAIDDRPIAQVLAEELLSRLADPLMHLQRRDHLPFCDLGCCQPFGDDVVSVERGESSIARV